ncbi:MAG TPA: hypothetical protein VM778_13955 [Gemmatimonadota bacterium]|nr:hypothetical protein [Gemmatimonadota bacterium]
MPRCHPILILVLAVAWAACDGLPSSPIGVDPPGEEEPPPSVTDLVPLTDLETGLYLGRYPGGLYPGGSDAPPADHRAAGLANASRIRPLDTAGRPDPEGKVVLLSVGMSNTSHEFCGSLGVDCSAGTFGAQAEADPRVDGDLVIVNGAQGGQDARDWDRPTAETYDVVRDRALAPLGLSETQVQVVWLKQAHTRPTVALPSASADAFELERDLGEIVRAMAARWPNLRLVFVSSRTYGGYATIPLNPEPFAYESGFAVKWLVEAQIEQTHTGRIDPQAGDLDLDRLPWIGWGPYLWTAGSEGRSDGLRWTLADVQADGTHPAPPGVEKVGALLLDFFTTDPVPRCWFVAGLDCD